MKDARKTTRFEVRGAKADNLLGYVYAHNIDAAYDKAAQDNKGADVIVYGSAPATIGVAA